MALCEIMDLVGFCLKIATSPQNLMFDYDFLPINVPILESEIAILRYSLHDQNCISGA